MVTAKVTFILSLATAVTLASCGFARSPAVRLTDADTGSSVQLRQGQDLEVTLQGNPTTGYTWEVLPGAETILEQQGEPKYEAESNLLGAGGSFTFTFKAVTEGETSLRLIYHRTFEPGVAPLQTFEAKVVVGP
jgi:inhibitor of cysteine peptidase